MLDDSTQTFKTQYHPAANTVTFKWSLPDSTHLVLTGAEATIRLRKMDIRLTNRGFHWINEYPLNR